MSRHHPQLGVCAPAPESLISRRGSSVDRTLKHCHVRSAQRFWALACLTRSQLPAPPVADGARKERGSCEVCGQNAPKDPVRHARRPDQFHNGPSHSTQHADKRNPRHPREAPAQTKVKSRVEYRRKQKEHPHSAEPGKYAARYVQQSACEQKMACASHLEYPRTNPLARPGPSGTLGLFPTTATPLCHFRSVLDWTGSDPRTI